MTEEKRSPEELLTDLRESSLAVLEALHPADCPCGTSNEEFVAKDRHEVFTRAMEVDADVASADFWKGVAVAVVALMNGAERVSNLLLMDMPQALTDAAMLDMIRGKVLTEVLKHGSSLAVGAASSVLEPVPPLETLEPPSGGPAQAA